MKIRLGLGRLTADKVASICGGTLYSVACEHKVLFETVCTDSREADNTSMFVAIRGERVDGHSFISNVVKQGCRCVIAERIPLDVKGIAVILVQDSVRAIRDIAEYVKSQVDVKTVAITGSVGKTTTKEFVSAVLDRKYKLYKTTGNFNSTIGMPMSMLELSQKNDAAVFEMGMSGLGEIEYMSEAAKPDVAIVTNIGSSHLEALGSRENICRAKMEITSGLRDGGTLFLNGDEPLLADHKSDRYNTLYFGMKNEACDYFASNVREADGGLVFDMRTPDGEYKNIEISLAGEHNVYNAMVAFSVGLSMNMNEVQIREGLISYVPAGMRQNIYEVGGVTVIEDCYNASPESMHAAINVLGVTAKRNGGRMIALLGDMRELGANSDELHREVGKFAAERTDMLFTLGQSGALIAEGAILGGLDKKKVASFLDGEEIDALVGAIRENLAEGDAILFKASRAMRLERVIERLFD